MDASMFNGLPDPERILTGCAWAVVAGVVFGAVVGGGFVWLWMRTP